MDGFSLCSRTLEHDNDGLRGPFEILHRYGNGNMDEREWRLILLTIRTTM